jgi:CheY-like chemotaxis protein
MVTQTELRLLLRAELDDGDGVHVTHTIAISDARALLRIDNPPPLGSRVRLRLSFPRLVAPFSLRAKVTSHHPGQRPGDPPAMEVSFDDEGERRELGRLLAGFQQRPSADAGARVTYRVLLVEDNEMIRDMFSYGVRKYFAKLDSRVTIDFAAEGKEAWSMLEQAEYDLVIVDFYLPVLDGSQLVARVRQNARLASLPVVGISVGGEDARNAMVEAGADLFLDKPVVLRDLLSTLDKLTSFGARP